MTMGKKRRKLLPLLQVLIISLILVPPSTLARLRDGTRDDSRTASCDPCCTNDEQAQRRNDCCSFSGSSSNPKTGNQCCCTCDQEDVNNGVNCCDKSNDYCKDKKKKKHNKNKAGQVVEYGNQNNTCWDCIGWKDEVSGHAKNKHGHLSHPRIQDCEDMQRDVTHHAQSTTGYCQTTFIINQTGTSFASDDFLEIHRSPAYIIDGLKVNTTGVTCESAEYQKGPAQVTAPILKCIEVCRGRDCNNSTLPKYHMLNDAKTNRCYDQNCGTPQSSHDIDDCDLDDAKNSTGHGVCQTITSYDSNDNLQSIQRTSVSTADPIPSTFGEKCTVSSGRTICEQKCVGDLCNRYTLSMHAVCLTCESLFPSLDFYTCLRSNQNSRNLVKICPNGQQYCVTRQAFDSNNNTIAVQKGCTHNSTSDFYTGHVIPFRRECWYIQDNPENNATYVCSQKYQGRSDEPTNTKDLTLGNFQRNPTTPSAGSVARFGGLLMFLVSLEIVLWPVPRFV